MLPEIATIATRWPSVPGRVEAWLGWAENHRRSCPDAIVASDNDARALQMGLRCNTCGASAQLPISVFREWAWKRQNRLKREAKEREAKEREAKERARTRYNRDDVV